MSDPNDSINSDQSDQTKLHILSSIVLLYKPYTHTEENIYEPFLSWLGIGSYNSQSNPLTYNFLSLDASSYPGFCLNCKSKTLENSYLQLTCYDCQQNLNSLPNQTKQNHLLFYQHICWIVNTLGIDFQAKFLYNLHSRIRSKNACQFYTQRINMQP